MTKQAIQKTEPAALQISQEMAELYQANATVGAENLGGQLPILKIHVTNKSKDNQLVDGSEPNNGWFFYKETQEQFQTVDCHILAISKGFRTDGYEGKKDVFHQILGGVIVDAEGTYKPFIFYFTGVKLNNLWEFGKEANKYTHRKPVPIPMFALTVRLSTATVDSDYGKQWVVKFEIVKDANGNPVLVTDPGEFQYLRDHVDTMKETFDQLVSLKTTEEHVEPLGQANEQHVSREGFDPSAGYNPFEDGAPIRPIK